MRSIFISIALLVLAISWAEPALRMPPNSYLVRPVNSVRELVQQIRGEPVVAQRYARHFKQPAYVIADFFEKNLRLTRLERSGEFFVYYAPSDGQLLVKRRMLPRGTEVFVLKSNNKPVLQKDCGNPMTAAINLPSPSVHQAGAPPIMVHTPTPVLAETSPQAALPGVEIVEVPLEESVAADLFPPTILSELETLPESAPEPPAVAAPVAALPAALPPAVSSLSGWWGALLSSAPFLLARGSGGPPEVIPEPATGMMLLTGLGLFYLSRRTRRSGRQPNSPRRA